MQNTKRSITFKVIIGYLMVAAVAAMAVWFTYEQVVKFSSINQSNNINNQQLVLVSEIATALYETESTGRQFIQTGDTTDLNRYSGQIDGIQESINVLKTTYADSVMKIELDSISNLLSRKSQNLEELLKLRSRDRNTSFYTEVIQELEKVDESFKDNDYDKRFANLEPHQRRVLIRLLEFSKEENQEQLSSISADSLVTSVKKVLNELERENQKFRAIINKKENELLDNDIILNDQLRNLLASVEQEERATTFNRAKRSQKMLNEISRILLFVGITSVLIVLFFLFLIIRDVSRSQRYRIQLEEAKAFTESLMIRREQFMATITHDLRSPLNTVLGYTELIGKTPLNNKQEHYLGHLRKSSEFILHLVNDLLDLSKLEAGKMQIEKLPFNAKKLLEETFYNIIPEDDPKNLELIVEAEENADVNVLSDPFRIKQILSNLINNSYKFTEKGSLTISVSLEKQIEDSYILTYKIKDTGLGISKDKQKEIFEEFSQEHRQIEKKYGGTGLGLAISKRITKLLKGELSLESDPGIGSEFTVRIPVIKLKDSLEIITESPISNTHLYGKNILAVDDESSQLALSRELIKSIGMHCDIAQDGKEALEKLGRKKYDLVLTDIQMPSMDGFELLNAIQSKKKLKHIPVIAASGRTTLSSSDYLDAGFSGNLLKPYKPQELLQKIGDVLNLELETNSEIKIQTRESSEEFSLKEILLFAGDDKDALNTILKVFVDASRKNLAAINKAIINKNKSKITAIAHKMLPMYKQLNTRNIVFQLQQLEKEVPEYFEDQKIKGLITEIEALLEKLEREIIV
ncbi:hybrid sensor histidine kinase/response regulator [Gillisia sp. JM1]|uniref:hybrid sensor histidine kinase/response regulator n=1 Tax=Gillisia sp. JM1 TaxID=1283286 RepID=UPI0004254DA6|nr:ATP-binding protein [Gillisia sp. JM1]